jgi:NTE family protein
MLRDVASGVTRLLSAAEQRGSRRKRVTTKKLNLALQGGGAHGAYTWGVLDQLLADERISIVGISGASAGAVNAVMLADGLARGGPEEARKRLADFWRASSIGGGLPGPQRAVVDRLLSLLPVDGSPVQFFMDTLARFLSPYDLNPLNINPLKDLIERFVDFDAVRHCRELSLFISATNVHTGSLRVFRREEITADVVMASAALPLLFRAVEIDGEPYWDGGFTGNPAILPLIEANETEDILLVQISPLVREETPTSAREILHRVNEITFNASLAAELRALEYVRSRVEKVRGAGHAIGRVNVHRIVIDDPGRQFGAGSRLNTDFDFFSRLHRAGRRAARHFLDNHFDDIGHRSTVDLATEIEAASA